MKFKRKHCPEVSLTQHQGLQLHQLIHHVNELTTLQAALTPLLDPTLAKHIQIASYEQGTLVVTTDSASWVTQIRFKTPELIKMLKKTDLFSKIKKIKALIRMEETTKPVKNPKTVTPITENNSTLIAKTAKTVKHKKLQEALKRLAR